MENIEKKQTLLETAQSNFEKWNEALKTENPDIVANVYLENGTLLGTFSDKLLIGRKEIRGYFEHFLLQHPSGKIMMDEVESSEDGLYTHAGFYDFTVGPEDRRENVRARFTFIWKKDKNGQWGILHHHSSEVPKK